MSTGSGIVQVVDDLDMDWQRRRGWRLGVLGIALRRVSVFGSAWQRWHVGTNNGGGQNRLGMVPGSVLSLLPSVTDNEVA